MLSSCLSSDLARRLCSFEWFYSAVGCTCSFGESWRFSELFLLEEREKPKLYRESVRQHCTQLCIGTMEVLPTDLSLPLSLGQHAIAIHPGTREVNDGKVLTMEHDCCRAQSDTVNAFFNILAFQFISLGLILEIS
ncbi:hypothetical protein V6N13_079902 [Hibiscus sabdariffa]|uniref:DIRP domain-containing protein n=1 Tax=Hibiscus sabdariffa TaxID=183260 RepID=A0ABR2RST1_9ROSI